MKKIALAVLTAIAIVSIAGNFYLGHKLTALAKNVAPVDDSAKIITQVGKLIELPDGETPTIAKVDDPEQLKKQGLFQKAQKGDTVLIYPTEKKAILYRSSENKIIEVTSVNVTETLPTKTPAPAPAPVPAPAVAPTVPPTP
ncbi:MAG: hypothetical protein WC802_03370 [Patescibacteria group bacterium]|jgi:hypothetical protein